ncbi:MAG: TonB-dependent receptor, partial [Myxococcota bacterium]|nr:TonB-dependent receptor [Myxococcota bacterium]
MRATSHLTSAVARGASRLSLATVGLILMLSSIPASSEESEAFNADEIVDIEELDLAALLETPLVSSASKRSQALDLAPASVTVLEQEALRAQPWASVSDALRRVVGVHVLRPAPNSIYVSMRGISAYNDNHLPILLNGRLLSNHSGGQPLIASVPVHVADLERIEVLRGPSSTLYGANAFSGVVSLSTKKPLDHQGAEGQFSLETRYVEENERDPAGASTIASGGRGYLAYGWANDAETIGWRLSGGLSHNPEPWPAQAYEHGLFSYYARSDLQVEADEDSSLNVGLSHVFSETDVSLSPLAKTWMYADSEQALDIGLQLRKLGLDDLDLSVKADLARHAGAVTSVKSDSSTLVERPSRYTAHGLMQADLRLWEERNVLSLGVETSYVDYEDWTRNPSYLYVGSFLQNETLFLEDRSLALSVGARFEHIASSDAGLDISYDHINPRAAIMWRALEDHAFRLAFATAFRTPTSFENFISRVSTFDPRIPPVEFIRANPRLEAEETHGIELAYLGRFSDWLRLDLTLYGQWVQNLVRLEPEPRLPVVYDNAEGRLHTGLELAATLALTEQVAGYVNYALTLVYDPDRDD